MTKLRIISDLHYDAGLNKSEEFDEQIGKKFEEEPDCVTLIAGDLAADIKNKKEFLEKYFKNQVVILTGGNHDVYIKGLKTIYEIDDEHKKEFPLTHLFWKYLNNDWTWIPGANESVAIIGSTFYTDYEYSNWTIESFNKQQRAWTDLMRAHGFKAEYEDITDYLKSIIKYKECVSDHACLWAINGRFRAAL